MYRDGYVPLGNKREAATASKQQTPPATITRPDNG